MGSTRFKRWVTSVPKAWMGETARRLWGGFATVAGDWAIDWFKRGLRQHHPELADDAALPLIGSGRRTYQGRDESLDSFRERLPRAIPNWKRAGSPLGLMYALYLEGYRGVVLVQQNGLAYELSEPIDPTDPEASLVVTELGTNPQQNDHPWWTFDNDDSYCSRFALLFPKGATSFARLGYATFTGEEDGTEDHPWPTAVFPTPFVDTTYQHIPGAPQTDGGGVSVWCIDDATKTINSIRVGASGPFVGVVPVLAWAIGDHPFAGMSAYDLARLKRIVNDWRPAKAKCMGAFVLISGEFWDWPVGTWDEPGGIWGEPGEVVVFPIEEN